MNHKKQHLIYRGCTFGLMLVMATGLFGVPLLSLADSLCAEVQIEITQELTLERQAFEAHMRINNASPMTLEHVSVVVKFLDEAKQPITASSNPNATNATFFIRIDVLDNINAVDGTGAVAPSTSADIRWLIIPAPGAGGELSKEGKPTPSPSQEGSQGKLYYVGATLTYTIGGEPYGTEVTPDYIYVRPMPLLTLDYFLPQAVWGDDPFTAEIEPLIPFSLGVRVSNTGFGTAWNLQIDSAQPRIVDNKQGLLVDFLILGSTVNAQPASPSLLVDFGDLDPQKASVARWRMTCSLSGEFTEFTAAFSHADALGGNLTSLIQAIHTHALVHDVLLDLPGRDRIPDFLATGREAPGASYTLYESDNLDGAVNDLSATAVLMPEAGSSTRYTLTLSAPPPGSEDDLRWYAHAPLPDALGIPEQVAAIRSDGKRLPAENVWLANSRSDEQEEESQVHLFDALEAGSALTEWSYTLVFEAVEDAHPPILEPIPNVTVDEGEAVVFDATASDPDGTIPVLTAAPLPVGAGFTDHGDGAGQFTWTPAAGQSGVFPVVVTASDGVFTASQTVLITVISEEQYTLTVVRVGAGSGHVSGDGGIECGSVCTASFGKYTRIYLDVMPDPNSVLDGVTGADCSVSGTCTVTLLADTTVTVTFSPQPAATPTPAEQPTPTPTWPPESTPTPGNPIPEPATLLLLGLGLLALIGLTRHRRRIR